MNTLYGIRISSLSVFNISLLKF